MPTLDEPPSNLVIGPSEERGLSTPHLFLVLFFLFLGLAFCDYLLCVFPMDLEETPSAPPILQLQSPFERKSSLRWLSQLGSPAGAWRSICVCVFLPSRSTKRVDI